MLKHATICRTNRAKQVLKQQWDDQSNADEECAPQLNFIEPCQLATAVFLPQGENANVANTDDCISPIDADLSANSRAAGREKVSYASSPTPSLLLTPSSNISSAPSSVFNSPSKWGCGVATCHRTASASLQQVAGRSGADPTIKVFAQTLSQDVEYVTLHVNAQTKSQQIIRSLLKKFRLKHRDPNLFYLTLERWIRKDGLKFKSVMLLGDEACPLQLQQCCSNPPHDDIKFTLQMRAGALVKIYCADVCPDTRYKCLSLSTQTTVDETIELMLHCLNMISPDSNNRHANKINVISNSDNCNPTASGAICHARQASSPDSSSSSSSTTSSSSGVESDPTNNSNSVAVASTTTNHHLHQVARRLDSNSRASSVTSISSSSNISNSSSQTCIEQYCLTIECRDESYKRVLESDELLVDVYQNLLDEIKEQSPSSPEAGPAFSRDAGNITNATGSGSISSMSSLNNQPDQWFVIKLKRRDDYVHQGIKFTNPRQNMPLPPIPPSLAQFNNANTLQHIVSTTQIEINHHQQPRPSSSLAITATSDYSDMVTTPANNEPVDVPDGIALSQRRHDANHLNSPNRGAPPINCHYKQISAIVGSSCGSVIKNCSDKMCPPPDRLIWLPPIKPRRRNLSNASSTFGRPQASISSTMTNRRRYDPDQLARDLNQLDLAATTDPNTATYPPDSASQASSLGGARPNDDATNGMNHCASPLETK